MFFYNTATGKAGMHPKVLLVALVGAIAADAREAVPLATFVPALSWHTDRSSLDNLKPRTNSQVYFTENGRADPHTAHVFALMDATSNHPSVMLDHTDAVKNVSCGDGIITLDFTDPRARSHAEKVWGDGEFAAITSSARCGGGQPSYWHVNHANFPPNSSRVLLHGTEVGVEHALDEVSLSWGTHVPNKKHDRRSSGNQTDVKTVTVSAYSSSAMPTACGSPPAPTISGLPAVACGDDFDERLNNAIGYLDFNDDNFSESLRQFAPGLSDTNVDDYQTDDIEYSAINPRAALRRRGGGFWSVTAFLQAIYHAMTNTVSAAANSVANVAKEEEMNGDLSGIVSEGHDLDTSVAVDVPPISLQLRPANSTLTDSNFGPAVPLYQGNPPILDVYCVDCWVQGSAHVSGQIKFSMGKMRSRHLYSD